MIPPERSVALVGRPNVGKSRLFNALAGRRIAIVHDRPGVTRDVNTAEVDDDFLLLDTGGIGLVAEASEAVITEAVETQVDLAIRAAGVIALVLDAREGLTALDEEVAATLRRQGKPVILVANKIDDSVLEELADPFASLGLGDPVAVSAEHGRGLSDLHARIEQALGPKPPSLTDETTEEAAAKKRRVKLAFVGRPNVGKSSLGNALLKSERLVVSDIPGTTRDAVGLDLDYEAPNGEVWPFRLVDTAGLRRRGRVRDAVEYFSTLRSRDAMAEADVVFHVLDAREGVTTQDKGLAGDIREAGRPSIVVVNKWDHALDLWKEGEGLKGYETLEDFRKHFEKALRHEIFFLPDSPILFTSATQGFRVEELLKAARKLDAGLDVKLPTGRLNAVLHDLLERNKPRYMKGKPFKIFYATQVGTRPLRLRCFCNRKAKLDEPYRRYLEKGIIEAFDLQGCPLFFEFVGKEKRFSGQPKKRGRPAPRR